VSPGRSTRVRSSTRGLYILRWIGNLDTPLLVDVKKLAPLIAAGGVDQLEDERAARHDALAAREKVAPDDAGRCGPLASARVGKQKSIDSLFEHAGFTRRLTADLQQRSNFRRGGATCPQDSSYNSQLRHIQLPAYKIPPIA
jgi:hypothetical protein